MLAEHPDVLSIPEFFVGLDWNRRLSEAPMTGPEFWDMLSAPHPFVTAALQRGYKPPEVVYPFGRPGVRFEVGEELPWILTCTLPSLTEDPDSLLDETRGFCAALGSAKPSVLAVQLFDWLTKLLGRSVWVEKSGASIAFLRDLVREYPDARFLHLHRAGEEAALSMREHPVFRIGAMLTYSIPIADGIDSDRLRALGDQADHIDRILASSPPAPYFGRWWSSQLLEGFASFGDLRAGSYHELRFEELLGDPCESIKAAASGLGLPVSRSGWEQRAAELVGAAPALRAPELPEPEGSRLRWECMPGNRLLSR